MPKILWKHLMPNTLAPLIVQGTYICASAILTEAILSFLGAGVSTEIPTWGNIMAEGRIYFQIKPSLIFWPGLMLSLDSGGSCTGVAYRLDEHAIQCELDVVWRREMFTGAYRPVWTTARTPEGLESVIVFSANRKHDRYAPGLEDEVIARFLATGAGPMGRCCDYLFETVAHLRQLGIRDHRLEALEARVRAHGVAP